LQGFKLLLGAFIINIEISTKLIISYLSKDQDLTLLSFGIRARAQFKGARMMRTSSSVIVALAQPGGTPRCRCCPGRL
jgi:hypothetical protein